MSIRAASTRRAQASSAQSGETVAIYTGNGNISVAGAVVTSNTSISLGTVVVGQTSANTTTATSSGPTITSVQLTDSTYTQISANTAAASNTTNYIVINGTGFSSGCTVYVNGVAQTTTFISSTKINCQLASEPTGTYSLMVFNTSGSGAVYMNLPFDSVPSFTTVSGSLGTFIETLNTNYQLAGTADTSPLTYSLYSGSLPTGATLSSSGLISGATALQSGNNTYTFTIMVSDPQGQFALRQFSMTINVDTVSWNTPTNGQTLSVYQNVAMSNVNLSTTDAAGYSVSYTANTLPTGITLSGNTIYGTATVLGQNPTTNLTATAATTGRSSSIIVYWNISVTADTYYNYTSLLLSGTGNNNANNNTFIDLSTNNYAVTATGNTIPGTFSPYGDNRSIFFNGTSDYILYPTSSSYQFSGDFTVEGWFYPVSAPGGTNYTHFFDFRSSGSSTTGFTVGTYASNQVVVFSGSSQIITGNTSYTAPINTWNHFAVNRTGTSMTLYLNGSSLGSITSSTNYSDGRCYIGEYMGGGQYFNGYMSNLRIVNGTGLYPSAFTPANTPLTAVANTTLLTLQSNRSIDTSIANTQVLTTNGGTIQKFSPLPGTIVTPFYGTKFNGTSDYLSIPATSSPVFSGNFTVECWYNSAKTTPGNYSSIINNAFTSSPQTGTWSLKVKGSTNVVEFTYYNGSSLVNIDGTSNVADGNWHHIAVSRVGTSVYLFVDGVLQTTSTIVSYQIGTTSATTLIGYESRDTVYLSGYLSNLRLVNGQALYTGNFTPPTSQLTTTAVGTSGANVASSFTGTTVLLTCQNSTFIDNSGGNIVISAASTTVKPVPVSPFTPTINNTPYNSSIYGGSIYFDNTSYLSIPSSSLTFGTNSFTAECWVYPVAYTATYSAFIDNWIALSGSFVTGQWQFGMSGTGTLEFIYATGASTLTTVATTTVIPLNQWTHVAVSRNGNALELFINGVPSTYAALSVSNIGSNTSTSSIGRQTTGTSYLFQGYMSDVRVVSNSTIYQANTNFYVPVNPLTAISNTQLLIAGTSGGIVDSSRTNDLQSSGNVIISTTTSKFGTSSIYFDGTGTLFATPQNANNFVLNTGDFTIESWVYPTSLSANSVVVSTKGATGDTMYVLQIQSNGLLNFSGGTTSFFTSSSTVSTNAWTHIAISRNSGVAKLFINGTQVANGASTTAFTSTTYKPAIGSNSDGTNKFTGYIQDVRVTRGYGRYPTAFTVPTAPSGSA
jgi:Concanavalin A-like lectin/glucanases superfamily